MADIVNAIKNFEVLQYLLTGSNLLDWCHFILITTGWILWNNHFESVSKFDMQSQYNVLNSPADQTEARFLSTNADEEKKFLEFTKEVSNLEQSLRIYTNIVSICGKFNREIHRLKLWIVNTAPCMPELQTSAKHFVVRFHDHFYRKFLAVSQQGGSHIK